MGVSFYEVTVSRRQCSTAVSSWRTYALETPRTTQLLSVACDLYLTAQWDGLSPCNNSYDRRSAVSVYGEEILLWILQLEHKNFRVSFVVQNF